DQVSVLINNAGFGFRPEIATTVISGVGLKSVAVTDLNLDGFPDLVVGLDSTTGFTSPDNNLFSLVGGGDGTFRDLTPYQVGVIGGGNSTIVAQATNPFLQATTFTVGGNMISPNLFINGNFENRDLTNEQGNLAGWQTATLPDSVGRWQAAPGTE